MGSSFLPGELIAAFLRAQLEQADQLTERRLAKWRMYYELLTPLQNDGLLTLPIVPDHCDHNAHMFYVLLHESIDRQFVLDFLKSRGILAVFHYVPLHSSPAGQRFGRTHGALDVTSRLSERLVRLPLWVDLSEDALVDVVEALKAAVFDPVGRRFPCRNL